MRIARGLVKDQARAQLGFADVARAIGVVQGEILRRVRAIHHRGDDPAIFFRGDPYGARPAAADVRIQVRAAVGQSDGVVKRAVARVDVVVVVLVRYVGITELEVVVAGAGFGGPFERQVEAFLGQLPENVPARAAQVHIGFGHLRLARLDKVRHVVSRRPIGC